MKAKRGEYGEAIECQVVHVKGGKGGEIPQKTRRPAASSGDSHMRISGSDASRNLTRDGMFRYAPTLDTPLVSMNTQPEYWLSIITDGSSAIPFSCNRKMEAPRSIIAHVAFPPCFQSWRVEGKRGGRVGIVVRLLAFHLGEIGFIPCGVAPGFSRVEIVPHDAAGRRAFSEISRFPRPFIPALLHSHLTSPSSTAKSRQTPLPFLFSGYQPRPEAGIPTPHSQPCSLAISLGQRPVSLVPHSQPCSLAISLGRRPVFLLLIPSFVLWLSTSAGGRYHYSSFPALFSGYQPRPEAGISSSSFPALFSGYQPRPEAGIPTPHSQPCSLAISLGQRPVSLVPHSQPCSLAISLGRRPVSPLLIPSLVPTHFWYSCLIHDELAYLRHCTTCPRNILPYLRMYPTSRHVTGRRHQTTAHQTRVHLEIRKYPMRVIEVNMERRRNEGAGRPTTSSSTIPTCENPVTRPGIEPGSLWWEASVQIAQPSWSPEALDLLWESNMEDKQDDHLQQTISKQGGRHQQTTSNKMDDKQDGRLQQKIWMEYEKSPPRIRENKE
ncbi:hypothetical protein PR048_004033 [Dryococelus australis]|uniref:Uncharacterized protein n=1 Tax=Dryococelus australis TaxID=614101 RepID=A0ABQ9I5D9_9NEOP|nr:hypothetical protein PR048_004033 [Dryococelus australis]